LKDKRDDKSHIQIELISSFVLY